MFDSNSSRELKHASPSSLTSVCFAKCIEWRLRSATVTSVSVYPSDSETDRQIERMILEITINQDESQMNLLCLCQIGTKSVCACLMCACASNLQVQECFQAFFFSISKGCNSRRNLYNMSSQYSVITGVFVLIQQHWLVHFHDNVIQDSKKWSWRHRSLEVRDDDPSLLFSSPLSSSVIPL